MPPRGYTRVSGFDDFIAGPLDREETNPDARPNRRLLWIDGLISNVSESFVASFVNPFAMALGATNGQIGALNAVANLGSALGLLPGARLTERSGRRKRIVVLTGGLAGRLLLLAVAALPLFLGSPAIIYAVIAVFSLRAFFNQLGYPAWSALVADLVPKGMRGRYLGARNIGLAIAALIFTPIAGRVIESIGGLKGYQASLALAAVTGLAATAVFSRIKEPQITPAGGRAHAHGVKSLELLRGNHPFAIFTGVALIWNLALQIAGPFFSVYLVRTLHGTPTQIGILAAVYSLGNILGQRLWGRLNDRHGAAWVMRLAGLLIPIVPIAWSIAPGPWWLLPVEFTSGFLWAGYLLANFNLLLGLAPEPQRARFVAVYQTVVFGAAFVGPLIGGLLADIIAIPYLMRISSAGRMLASLVFLRAFRTEESSST
jgi:MFS family permease